MYNYIHRLNKGVHKMQYNPNLADTNTQQFQQSVQTAQNTQYQQRAHQSMQTAQYQQPAQQSMQNTQYQQRQVQQPVQNTQHQQRQVQQPVQNTQYQQRQVQQHALQPLQTAQYQQNTGVQKKKYPYDKFVRKVFSSWENVWNEMSFNAMKAELKKNKPFGYLTYDNILVLTLPFSAELRDYLRNKYGLTYCAKGKFWGINLQVAQQVINDIMLATSTGLQMPNGSLYTVPKSKPKNQVQTSSGFYLQNGTNNTYRTF